MSVGLDPDTFWTKTPRQIVLILEGKAEKFKREHDTRAWLAWHMATLVRCAFATDKHGKPLPFPKLETLLSASSRTPRREMSPDLQWQVMSSIATH